MTDIVFVLKGGSFFEGFFVIRYRKEWKIRF